MTRPTPQNDRVRLGAALPSTGISRKNCKEKSTSTRRSNSSAQTTLDGHLKQLNGEGACKPVQHKEPLSTADMQKLLEYFEQSTPTQTQFFTLRGCGSTSATNFTSTVAKCKAIYARAISTSRATRAATVTGPLHGVCDEELPSGSNWVGGEHRSH